jgi:hypothetical protein
MKISRLIAWSALAAVLAAVVVYLSLVRDGSAVPPDINALERAIGVGTTSSTAVAGAVGFAVVVGLVVLAPIIYAVRAHDVLTILVSLALTGVAAVLLIGSHSAFGQISALILYLANLTLSAAVYVAHRIAPPTT